MTENFVPIKGMSYTTRKKVSELTPEELVYRRNYLNWQRKKHEARLTPEEIEKRQEMFRMANVKSYHAHKEGRLKRLKEKRCSIITVHQKRGRPCKYESPTKL